MSSYTTQLRWICEQKAIGNPDTDDYAKVIAASKDNIFDFSYPIFDSAYRPTLETKILKHYYMREIACETYGQWKLQLDTRMNEVMPYFNQLYESTLLKFDPLINVDVTTTFTGDRSQDENGKTDRGDSTTSSETINTTGTNNREDKGKTTEESTTNGNGKTSGTITTTGKKTDSYTKDNTLTDDTTGTEGTGSNASHSTTGNSTEQRAHSDTPQNGLTDVDDLKYLTDYGKNTISNSSSQTDEESGHKTTTSKLDRTAKEVNAGEEDTTESRDESATSENHSGTKGSGTSSLTSDTTTTGQEIHKGSGSLLSAITDEKTLKELLNNSTHVKGMQGKTAMELIMEYRETMLNIDMMVIESLSDLFFGIWEPI